MVETIQTDKDKGQDLTSQDTRDGETIQLPQDRQNAPMQAMFSALRPSPMKDDDFFKQKDGKTGADIGIQEVDPSQMQAILNSSEALMKDNEEEQKNDQTMDSKDPNE